MTEKDAVTIQLTGKQRDAIKKATGRTIRAVKVENARGRTVLKSARIRLTRPRTPGGLDFGDGTGDSLPRPFIK